MTREEAIENFKEFIDHFQTQIKQAQAISDKAFDVERAERDIQTFEMAIQALEQEPCDTYTEGYFKGYDDGLEQKLEEPCDDAISRILKRMWNCRGKHTAIIDKVKMEQIIRDELPSVTQKSGKWIEHPEIETSTPEYLMFYECSECGDKQCFYKSDIHKKRFCTNCGAKMVEPQERSDKE